MMGSQGLPPPSWYIAGFGAPPLWPVGCGMDPESLLPLQPEQHVYGVLAPPPCGVVGWVVCVGRCAVWGHTIAYSHISISSHTITYNRALWNCFEIRMI